MSMTEQDMIRAITTNVSGAQHMRNFWIARPVDPDTRELGDPLILEWEVEGIEQPSLALIGAWVAVLEPEPAQYKTRFSVLEFRERFTLDEQIAIRQAQFTDMEVGLVYDGFMSADHIDLGDLRIEQGLDLYISKGLIKPDRKPEIMQPELIPPAA